MTEVRVPAHAVAREFVSDSAQTAAAGCLLPYSEFDPASRPTGVESS